MSNTRRDFLGRSGAMAALGLAALAPGADAGAAALPHIGIGKAAAFKVGKPITFTYPDTAALAIAVKLSKPNRHGVGPHGDIIAYSQLCVHKGCPVAYNAQDESFVCPCHFSAYDAEQDGQLIIGHATTSLPRIILAYDKATDIVSAIGVDGLIYGRVDNAPLHIS